MTSVSHSVSRDHNFLTYKTRLLPLITSKILSSSKNLWLDDSKVCAHFERLGDRNVFWSTYSLCSKYIVMAHKILKGTTKNYLQSWKRSTPWTRNGTEMPSRDRVWSPRPGRSGSGSGRWWLGTGSSRMRHSQKDFSQADHLMPGVEAGPACSWEELKIPGAHCFLRKVESGRVGIQTQAACLSALFFITVT